MQAPKTLRHAARSGTEIAGELRREFDLKIQELYGTQPKPDPVLMTLFHSLAVQIARIYDKAEHDFPLAVFDDLVTGLGMPGRLAQPSQAVVCFTELDQREQISPEVELLGTSRSGEQIVYTPDDVFEVATSQLVFAAAYEQGRLHSLPGARVGEMGPPIPPGNTPADLGEAAPTLFLAFETDELHLSGLGLLIDTLPADGPVGEAIRRSPWYLLNPEGAVTEAGVMRGRPGRGGLQRLEWFADSAGQTSESAVHRVLELGEGPFGGQVWIFPNVPPDRRYRSALPPAIAAAAPYLLPEGHGDALDRPLAWVQIPLPAGTRSVVSAFQRVAVNCVTASNIEIFNEQVAFDRMGSATALRPEGSIERHLMGILSVTGEEGTPYVESSDIEAPAEFGRYRYRRGRIEYLPAKLPNGQYDGYAMVRLLYCDGAKGNGLEVGDINRIRTSIGNVTAQVSNLTVSRGGSEPPEYVGAKQRFAELLRTRERIVTEADIEVACRAFDPRIRTVAVTPTSHVSTGGVRLVEVVNVGVRREDFADPDAELVRLRDLLEQHLQQRCVLGRHIRVTVDEIAS